MTPTEKLLAEQEKIVAERGYYIRPVRMANLMKAASRIFDILTKADTAISYEECRIVLEIVARAIDAAAPEPRVEMPEDSLPAEEYAYCNDVCLGLFELTAYCPCSACCGKNENS